MGNGSCMDNQMVHAAPASFLDAANDPFFGHQQRVTLKKFLSDNS